MQPFGRQLITSLAQVLGTLNAGGAGVILHKHTGLELNDFAFGLRGIVDCLNAASAEAIGAIIVEVVSNKAALRAGVSPRYVFESAFEDFSRWLSHDGWAVEDRLLRATGPAVEETTGLRDELFQTLERSQVDADGEVRSCLTESTAAFIKHAPDYNESSTKVRIALETFARRLAQIISKAGDGMYAEDSWGRALQYLGTAGAITPDEEKALAAVYTATSPGAHVPQSLDAEQWARLVRTLCIGGLYLLVAIAQGRSPGERR
jgi:hypothetical protein